MTDAGLEHLKGLTQLQSLDLTDTKVTDAGLEHLKGLTQLQSLNLMETEVTDAGLVHLKGLPQLQSLDLAQTKVTDAGLVHLEGVDPPPIAGPEGTKVTDAGLSISKGSPSSNRFPAENQGHQRSRKETPFGNYRNAKSSIRSTPPLAACQVPVPTKIGYVQHRGSECLRLPVRGKCIPYLSSPESFRETVHSQRHQAVKTQRKNSESQISDFKLKPFSGCSSQVFFLSSSLHSKAYRDRGDQAGHRVLRRLGGRRMPQLAQGLRSHRADAGRRALVIARQKARRSPGQWRTGDRHPIDPAGSQGGGHRGRPTRRRVE